MNRAAAVASAAIVASMVAEGAQAQKVPDAERARIVAEIPPETFITFEAPQEKESVVVSVAHVAVGGVRPPHRRNPVPTRLRARDAPIAIVVVPRERTAAGPRGRVSARRACAGAGRAWEARPSAGIRRGPSPGSLDSPGRNAAAAALTLFQTALASLDRFAPTRPRARSLRDHRD